jgi:hypothetical protein
MITRLLKKAKETAKCLHQACYDFCYDLVEGGESSQVEQVSTETPETPETPPEQPAGFQPRPTFMKGFLCASFEDETSLGMAAMVVAIDKGHARSLLNAELKKQGLRLEDDDELVEIDLHNPGVLLSRNSAWDSPRSPWDSV